MTTNTIARLANSDLVGAWEEVRYIDEVDYEREAALIVRLPDGRFFTTGFRPYTSKVRDNFGIDSDRWDAIDAHEVIESVNGSAPVLVTNRKADWIGRYHPTQALLNAANGQALKVQRVTLDEVFSGRFLKA